MAEFAATVERDAAPRGRQGANILEQSKRFKLRRTLGACWCVHHRVNHRVSYRVNCRVNCLIPTSRGLKMAAILRVKRKNTDIPLDTLVIACKRPKTEASHSDTTVQTVAQFAGTLTDPVRV